MNGADEACAHCGLPLPPGRRGAGGAAYCCFGCRLARELALPAAEEGADDASAPPTTLLLRLGLGIFLALNIMVASWLPYARDLFGGSPGSSAESALTALAGHLALFLCTIVLALLGLPMLLDALTNLLAPGRGLGGRVNAQLLIVIGVFSAFALSVWNVLRGEGSLYFDTAANVLVVVTLGSYLEAGARQRATAAAHRLLAALPRTVRVQRPESEHETVEIALEEVRVGDRLSVLPGETVPVDGRVREGASRVDESSLTGESWPRRVEPGDRLLAGSQNHEGRLSVVAERVAHDTVLALMERSLREARVARPPIQRLADRVAAVFVPGVVALAVVLFVVFAVQGAPAPGLLRSLSVLLISCPCALGLAAPLASWHGLRRAAENGILVDSAVTLERAAGVRRLFLDKTGTLTRPEPSLERLTTAPGVDRRWALEAAAGLEATSSHPIGRALSARAAELEIEPRPVVSAADVAGFGVEGTVDDRRLRFGSARWAESLGLDRGPLEIGSDVPPEGGPREDRDALYLMDERRVLARYGLREEPREEAAAALAELRAHGLAPAVLSGDAALPTRRLAERLGLPAEGGLLPTAKVDRLRAARREGGPVAMVGDGINDSLVLAAADVGIAMGSGSDLAKRSGNVRLISDHLGRVPLLFAIARDVRRRIRANLLFAFGFNSIGIGLAAAGVLTPVAAAVAMVLSSLAVVRISSGAGLAAVKAGA